MNSQQRLMCSFQKEIQGWCAVGVRFVLAWIAMVFSIFRYAGEKNCHHNQQRCSSSAFSVWLSKFEPLAKERALSSVEDNETLWPTLGKASASPWFPLGWRSFHCRHPQWIQSFLERWSCRANGFWPPAVNKSVIRIFFNKRERESNPMRLGAQCSSFHTMAVCCFDGQWTNCVSWFAFIPLGRTGSGKVSDQWSAANMTPWGWSNFSNVAEKRLTSTISWWTQRLHYTAMGRSEPSTTMKIAQNPNLKLGCENF